MYDPLKAKGRLVAFAGAVFVGGLAVASGLGWTSTSHAMPPITEEEQVPASAVQPALDLSEAFTNLADAVTPAVVRIETRRTVQSRNRQVPEQFRRFFDEESEDPQPRNAIAGGSGFIVSTDGYILTNNHVVEGANDVRVYFPDRRYFQARVVGADPFTDVAVIKVDVEEELPVMSFGDSDDINVGEWILAIGNPGFGASTQLDFTVTAGIISARGRGLRLLQNDIFRDPRFADDPSVSGYAIEDFIQTDAVINPGNSGGPMVNLQGHVVGINSAIASTTGVYQGYGFAIPINLARRIMEDLVEYGYVKRPRIGVQILVVAAEDAEAYGLPSVSGILVQSVDETGPSAGALRAEDVIRGLDGQPVGYVSELQAEIAERRPGDSVELTIYRNRREMNVDVRLGEAPINNFSTVASERPVLAEERLGIQVEMIDADLAREAGFGEAGGVLLTNVARGSAAERRNVGGFLGQKLSKVNEARIDSPQDLRRVLDAVEPGEIISLHFVDRTGAERVVNVRMP
ncbi:MAG: trypsin-like peptidase domain-containing protein [Gemmatimonadota bacterium]|nr:trypsin-like peptidase domain-containing protein [Gemmatimonadota bacterium]